MLHRFATYEEAALFVAKKRDEGYFAEILHDNVGAFWGPLLAGGVSAWVSEFAAEEGEEVPLPDAKFCDIPQKAAAVFAGVVLLIAGLTLALPLFAMAVVLFSYPLLAVGLVVYVFLLCVIGLFGCEFTRTLRDPESKGHGAALLLFGFLVPFMVLVVLFFFPTF